MTQTVGYWCDECRVKYVQHMCHDGLPCGHDKQAAIYIYAKNYSKGGEYIEIQHAHMTWTAWLRLKPREQGVTYIGRPIIQVETEDGWINYWDWLCEFHANVIRAVEGRWTSDKFPPHWRSIEQHKASGRQRGGAEEE